MSTGKQVGRIAFRYVLPAVLVAAVGWQFSKIIRNEDFRFDTLEFRWPYLIGCSALYIAAHMLWCFNWSLLLRHQGVEVSYLLALRAYFISLIGKYIPGKIWVITIRMAILGEGRASKTAVGMTALFETFTAMASGAFLAAILIPWLPIDLAEFGLGHQNLYILGLIPVGLWLMNRLIIQVEKMKGKEGVTKIQHTNVFLLIFGMFLTAIGWLLLGLSFWMCIQCVLPETSLLDRDTFLRLTAMNAMAYLAGFVVLFAPAGAGAREFILQKLLTLELTAVFADKAAGAAVAVALLLRLVWTASEVVFGLVFYKFLSNPARPSAGDQEKPA